jgi:hypothetical protein
MHHRVDERHGIEVGVGEERFADLPPSCSTAGFKVSAGGQDPSSGRRAPGEGDLLDQRVPDGSPAPGPPGTTLTTPAGMPATGPAA